MIDSYAFVGPLFVSEAFIVAGLLLHFTINPPLWCCKHCETETSSVCL